LSRTSKHEESNGSCEDGGLRAPSDSNFSQGRRAGDSLEKQDYDCYTSEGADAISRRPQTNAGVSLFTKTPTGAHERGDEDELLMDEESPTPHGSGRAELGRPMLDRGWPDYQVVGNQESEANRKMTSQNMMSKRLMQHKLKKQQLQKELRISTPPSRQEQP